MAHYRRHWHDIDLVVLDVLMPELDGLSVCRAIRKHSAVPIIFLSSRAEEVDRILGLELGGDDYVTKPFDADVLLARIRAVLRRASGHPKGNVLEVGDLVLNQARRELQRSGEPVELTVVSKPESVFAALGEGIEAAVAQQSARIRAATVAADGHVAQHGGRGPRPSPTVGSSPAGSPCEAFICSQSSIAMACCSSGLDCWNRIMSAPCSSSE